jgi:hypothetical protein
MGTPCIARVAIRKSLTLFSAPMVESPKPGAKGGVLVHTSGKIYQIHSGMGRERNFLLYFLVKSEPIIVVPDGVGKVRHHQGRCTPGEPSQREA